MSEAADGRDLDALVTEWLDWAATAKALGVSVNQGPDDDPRAPAGCRRARPVAAASRCRPSSSTDGEIVKGLPGLLTIFHDAGWDDREAIEWIFTDAEPPGQADRRAPREPRRRGQAARPGPGVLTARRD